MSVELVTKFSKYVDEQFKAESKRNLLTNNDYDWIGAHIVKVYTVTTVSMNDYDREGVELTDGRWSRYGLIEGLDATTQELPLKRDRSFTFVIDKLDNEETGDILNAAAALARQVREVIVPEVDSYTYGVMCDGAGVKPDAMVLTADNIYEAILAGSTAIDEAEAPDITMETDIGQAQRQLGVIGLLDGCSVIKVPANRVPADFGFMIAHPSATVAPVKLEEYKIHIDPPGLSGNLVEGRVCYDAFVLENKKNGIYYQASQAAAK